MYTIRLYQPEDREQVEHCFAEMINYEHRLDKFTVPGDPIAPPYMDWLLAECAQKQGAIFVAQVGDTLAGFISMYVQQDSDITTSLNEYLYISDFIVSTHYRGQGIGSALLAQAEAYAREIGQKVMQLHVLANNETALSVYQRSGLQPYLLTLLKEIDA